MFNVFKLRAAMFIAGIVSILFFSCGGSGGDDDSIPTLNTPTNLVLTATINGADPSNPTGNGSGIVTFNFSADNATLYKISLGNGEIKETTSNTLSYTYVGAGVQTYKIYVSAYKGDKFITKDVTITIKINSTLLWYDEFNGTGAPDASKWGYDIGNSGWGNNELQYYTNRTSNVIVEGGFLKITAKKESYQGAEYTSTRLLTKGKFSFTYGKVEVRAKLPSGRGTWPAIWMLGDNITTVNWPACGEIDIMEYVGYQPNVVHSAIHTTSSSGNTVNHKSYDLTTAEEEFHVYGIEWTSTEIRFYVDETLHYTYKPATYNEATWPFTKNQFLILNLAVGGNWGGSQGIDDSIFPQQFIIDYVRVYQ